MHQLDAQQIAVQAKLYGRTYLDNKESMLYFNWTCGGLEVDFVGSCLAAEFCVKPDSEFRQEGAILDWPWIAVILDGNGEIHQRILLDQEKKRVILFSSEEEERHRIRIVKLTENLKTTIGIRALLLEGNLEKSVFCKNNGLIELIGDSITCGFGNMAAEGCRYFHTAEENGWQTHGAIAARNLNMDTSFICISGITTARRGDHSLPYVMEELYPYTDRVIQDNLGQSAGYEQWNFKEYCPDIIVLNLGTNDSTMVMLSDDPETEESLFESDYYRFIRMVRTLNGEASKIICAMGSIDYYLYDTIRRTVERWKKDTGDKNIYTMKYTKMLNIGSDVGACFHPSASRQAKMAEELTAFIRKLEED